MQTMPIRIRLLLAAALAATGAASTTVTTTLLVGRLRQLADGWRRVPLDLLVGDLALVAAVLALLSLCLLGVLATLRLAALMLAPGHQVTDGGAGRAARAFAAGALETTAAALTPWFLRRVVGVVCSAGIVGPALLVAPAHGTTTAPAISAQGADAQVAPARLDEASSRERPHPLRGLRLPDLPLTMPDGPSPPASPDRQRQLAADRAGTVVVRRGDSLWVIAARLLPANATAAEVAVLCDRLYAANATRIGPDPNLILPGTRLVDPGARR